MHDNSLPTGFKPVYPILDAFRELGVSNPKGYELVNSGELETYTIGVRRFTTGAALSRLIESRISDGVDPRVSRVRSAAGALGAAKRHSNKPPEAA